MGRTARRTFAAGLVGVLVVIGGAVPLAAGAASSDLTVTIVDWCPPQLGACVSPDHPCAGLNAPGRPALVKLRVEDANGVVPFARVAASGAAPAWTNREGAVALSISPASSVEVTVEAAGHTKRTLALPAFWGGLVAGPTASAFRGRADSAIPVTVAARLEGLGVAPPVPLTVVLDGAGFFEEVPVEDGLARFAVHRGAAGSGEYRVVDGAPCGLPVVRAEPVSVFWEEAGVAAAAPRVLSIPDLDGWVKRAPFVVPVEADGPYEWRLPGADEAWRAPPIALGPGVHRLEARLVESGAGAGPSRLATALVRIDAAAPVLEASFSAAERGWLTDATVRWVARDETAGLDLATARLEVDGAPIDLAAAGEDFAPGGGRARTGLSARLLDGVHTIRLSIRDLAGHEAAWEGRVSVDLRPPVVALDTDVAEPASTGWWTRAVLITPRASDDGSGLASAVVLVDGTPVDDLDPVTLDGEGSRTVSIVAHDRAGHEARIDRRFDVDGIAPRLHLPEQLPANTAGFRFRVDEFGSGVRDATLASPAERGNVTISIEALGDGAYDVVVDLAGWTGESLPITVSDRAGNVAGGVVSLAVATTGPVTPPAQFTIQALVVSPSDPAPASDVRVTASVSGIRGGTLALVDGAGRRHDIGAASVADGRLVASGHAPGPGQYDVVLYLETEEGVPLEHRDGKITVKETTNDAARGGLLNAAPSSVPGAPVLAGVLAIALAALGRARTAAAREAPSRRDR